MKSPVREYRPPGSVRGAPGNRRPYRDHCSTTDEDVATQIVLAKNQALRQPALNLQIAKAYLAGSDSGVATRTWQQALEALVATKQGENQRRWQTAIKDKAFDSLRRRILIETRAEELLAVIEAGTVSTNVFLRKLHNFCQDMNWLPWPIIPKRQWPAVHYGVKRAITWKEHLAIVERETNPERKAFYQLAWHLGASQSDLAGLRGEDIDCLRRLGLALRSPVGHSRRHRALADCGSADKEVIQRLSEQRPDLDLYVSVPREDAPAERRYDFRPLDKIKQPKAITDPVLQAMAAKLKTPEGRTIYRQRACTVEPVFGSSKRRWAFGNSCCAGWRK
jgi:hypothetical protein